MARTVLIFFCAFAMIIALILLIDQTWLLTAALGLIAAIMLIIHRNLATTIVFFLILLICVPTEIVLVHFGVWSYPHETFAGVPLWIMFVWSNMVLVFIHCKNVLDKKLRFRA